MKPGVFCDWRELRQCRCQAALHFLQELAHSDGNPALPIVGYELMNGNAIVGMAELAWPELKIALSITFFASYAKLPARAQEKTMRFVQKFRDNPKSPGINYELIHDASDSNMRSVRIDQNYRGIVYKPKEGNVYLLLWVDNHDQAYQWARKARCGVNPEIGSIQLWFSNALEDAPEAAPLQHSIDQARALFASYSDRQLLSLGVPEECLAAVRLVMTHEQLPRLVDRLPKEAYEALYWLADGEHYEEVCAYITSSAPLEATTAEKVDIQDFSKALENYDTQRRFFVVDTDNEEALNAMLNAPLDMWRVFLHPSQRKLVEKSYNGPTRVLGGAGTGKTIAALHRAKWLAEKFYCGQECRVLFTTYTRNLAIDIRQNLEKICTAEVMCCIEVVHLDGWVSGYLRNKGYKYKIHYHSENSTHWDDALAMCPLELKLPQAFYREEWERVISAQGIENRDQYLQASRAGRGIKLSRKGRAAVWTVFEEYRHILSKESLKEREDAFRDARQFIANSPNVLPYQTIIVDEAQDMGSEAFKLLAQIVKGCDPKNSLFIAGDAHQSIYQRKVVLSRCGIDIRGRSAKLKINYRTTEQNRKWAVDLLHGIDFDDLDGHSDTQKGYVSLLQGEKPQIRQFKTFEAESKGIVAIIEELRSGSSEQSICLVARTKGQIDRYRHLIEKEGIATYTIESQGGDDQTKKGIRLATMHRVKGLEFDAIIIAGVSEGYNPLLTDEARSEDPTVRKDHLSMERSLLYVAATRAKRHVFVTTHGMPSPFLQVLLNDKSSFDALQMAKKEDSQ
jgi:superfamily I DNA/RNA helicase/mRNA-degrading endonuclease RelE of RelBE toxin-antitoxin system